MTFPGRAMVQGTITVASSLPSTVNVNCGFVPSKVNIVNQTQFGATGTGNENIQWLDWQSDSPTKTNAVFINAAGTALVPSQITSNAISTYDGKGIALGSQVTGTTITKANPAVCTATAHGLQTGDVILMTNNAVMTQLGGLYFSVTVTGANTFTIPINTNTANFTAETSFKFRKVTVSQLFYPGSNPGRLNISNITAANPMVVTTLSNHGLTVGQQVRLRVPSAFGMVQANNLQGIITAVTTTTFTLGAVDSSAFTAWAWPATTSVPFSPAQVVPVGSGPAASTFGLVTYNTDVLDDATLNQQFQGFTIGTNILVASAAGTVGVTASDVLTWTAWRQDA